MGAAGVDTTGRLGLADTGGSSRHVGRNVGRIPRGSCFPAGSPAPFARVLACSRSCSPRWSWRQDTQRSGVIRRGFPVSAVMMLRSIFTRPQQHLPRHFRDVISVIWAVDYNSLKTRKPFRSGPAATAGTCQYEQCSGPPPPFAAPTPQAARRSLDAALDRWDHRGQPIRRSWTTPGPLVQPNVSHCCAHTGRADLQWRLA